MAYYSFIVFNESGDVVTLPQHFLVLDTGKNVFSSTVKDLEVFTETLKTAGVRVYQVNRLDTHVTVDPAMYLFETDNTGSERLLPPSDDA